MDIKYQFFNDNKLLVQRFSGVFSFEKHLLFMQFQFENDEFNLVEKVLIDLRDLHFEVSIVVFKKLMDYIIRIRKNAVNNTRNQDAKIVFWVNKPLTTVIAHQVKRNNPHLDYNYCSSAENVAQILQLQSDFDLDDCIKNLKNTF